MNDRRPSREPEDTPRDTSERSTARTQGEGQTVIDAQAFAARLVALFVKGGPLAIPRARRDQLILLKAIALTLKPQHEYSEFEINAAIQEWLAVVAPRVEADHVTLRRMLVDEGFLARDGYGAIYQLSEPREASRFAAEVDSIDVWRIIDEARREVAGRRAARR